MNIEGTYTLQAPPEEVWRCLLDPQILQRTVPGIEHIEQAGEDHYTAVINLKQSPLKGTYQGRIVVSEQQPPYHYRITVEGEGRQIALNAAGSIVLNERNGGTIIAYRGELTLRKTSPLLRPALLRGAAKLLIQQFFTALAGQLRTRQSSYITEAVLVARTGSKDVGGKIVVMPSETENAAAAFSILGIFQEIVHRLQLGKGDPMQETRWARRLQRVGFVAGLLLLVWVGTQLPSRRR